MSGRRKLTDYNLRLFSRNLLNHYQKFVADNPNADTQEIYNDLYLAAYCTLSLDEGSLSHLEPGEIEKAYIVLDIISQALLLNRQSKLEQQFAFTPHRPKFKNAPLPTPGSITIYQQNYNCHQSLILDWFLINSLSQGMGTSTTHTTQGKNKKNDNAKQALAVLALIALAAAAAVGAFIALFYMCDQFINSMDRLLYNEGWLKAALMLASSVIFSSLSTLLALTFITTPLIALAIAAGLNPVGVVVLGVLSLTIMSAGIASFVTSSLYVAYEKRANPDSMDSSDPSRFRLTPFEEQALTQKGIDPLAVKCAIAALRDEMSKVMQSDSLPSSYMGFWFAKGKRADFLPLLDKLRDLRSGVFADTSKKLVTVGNLTFDCALREEGYQSTYNPNDSSKGGDFNYLYNQSSLNDSSSGDFNHLYNQSSSDDSSKNGDFNHLSNESNVNSSSMNGNFNALYNSSNSNSSVDNDCDLSKSSFGATNKLLDPNISVNEFCEWYNQTYLSNNFITEEGDIQNLNKSPY